MTLEQFVYYWPRYENGYLTVDFEPITARTAGPYPTLFFPFPAKHVKYIL